MPVGKKLIAVICIFALMLTFVACGKTAKPAQPAAQDPAQEIQSELSPEEVPAEEIPAAPQHPEDEAILNAAGTVYDPMTGVLGVGVSGTTGPGVFKVSIVGAEFFRSADDKEAVRIYYDVTSYASWIIDAADVSIQAAQDNEYLWGIDMTENTPDAVRVSHSDIRNGVTIRCAREFECDWQGGPIYVETWYFMAWSHMLDDYVYEGAESADTGLFDDSLIARFDPAGMPARPAYEVDFAPIAAPDWLNGVPTEGGFSYDQAYLAFLAAAVFQDGDRNVIRVYVSFTNTDNYETSYLNYASDLRVMQDGIELWKYQGDIRVAEDDNVERRLQPNETVTVAQEFVLRSDSPVTFEFHDFGMSKPVIAVIYPASAS